MNPTPEQIEYLQDALDDLKSPVNGPYWKITAARSIIDTAKAIIDGLSRPQVMLSGDIPPDDIQKPT